MANRKTKIIRIFWALFQLSGIFGNFGTYIFLEQTNNMYVLFSILTGCGILGNLLLLFLRPIPTGNQ